MANQVKILRFDPRLTKILSDFVKATATKNVSRMGYSDYSAVRSLLRDYKCEDCEDTVDYFLLDDQGELECSECCTSYNLYDYSDYIGNALVGLYKQIINETKATMGTRTRAVTRPQECDEDACDSEKICDSNNNKKVDGGVNMLNMNGMFKNLKFGVINSDSFKLSPLGVAFKTKEGYAVYNTDKAELTDVEGMVFDIPNSIFAMPVAQSKVKVNDIIIHSGSPVVVKEVKDSTLVVVYPFASEVKEVIPTKSIFGFNFYTKITALFDMGKADSENPFGNIMPMLMMSGSNGGNMNPMAMMMMMGGLGDEDSKMDLGFSKEMMMAMAFSGMGTNGTGNGGNDMMMALAMSKMLK